MNEIIALKKNEDRRLRNGHLWVFSNEIERVDGEPRTGDVVTLNDHAGNFLGKGFYNPHSLISVRLLTNREDEEIDSLFFQKRIETAFALRKKLYPEFESYRLVHGESDFLPGLVVDKYNDYLSIQTYSYGMDQRLPVICDVLEEIFHPSGIVERNETPIRTLEGLERKTGILRGTVEPITISEYGIRYAVDLLNGQKTGFFLDQRENRKAIQRYTKDARVLDCFCNDGGFALNAAMGGASEIIGVDVSEPAIKRAEQNAALNGMSDRVRFVAHDAFDYLDELAKNAQSFDLIILDPPSFAKSKKNVRKAKKGYRELHTLAYRVLRSGGILASASCSHHLYQYTFLDIINATARDAGRTIGLLEWHGAAPDHPVLPMMPETSYLKFGIFQVA